MQSKQITIALYHIDGQNENAQVLIKDSTIWASQKTIAELFGVSVPTINEHIKNILSEDELDKNSTIRKILIVQNEGTRQVSREIEHYNLDMIISVGYRVNSKKATHFRIWATKVLKEFTLKGFVLDDERLKQGGAIFDKDYFKELLERVRSIRASERRIYQQITDIFAECSIDYDKNSAITQEFYATIQNKFHYAITHKTAAQIIYENANAQKENMGLTSWKNAPKGRILKSDVSVAKNYLNEAQIRKLERAVSGYFDYIEDLIERENTFTMEEFAKSVNEFLAFRKYDILKDKGKISHQKALEKANSEYEIFNKTQKIESDFDKRIKALENKQKDSKWTFCHYKVATSKAWQFIPRRHCKVWIATNRVAILAMTDLPRRHCEAVWA